MKYSCIVAVLFVTNIPFTECLHYVSEGILGMYYSKP